MRVSEPHPHRSLPGSRFMRDALGGIGRRRNGGTAPRSMTGAPSPSGALAAGTSSVTSAAPATADPLGSSSLAPKGSVAVEREVSWPERSDPTEEIAPPAGPPVDQEDGLFGGTLPPVSVQPDDGWVAPHAQRYVPLASGYRSAQTRVIGLVGLAILVAILSVAITFAIYVASSTVVTKIAGYANSPTATVPAKITKAPGSQGSHHATPGPAAG